jgi:hypothetical protein
MLKSANINWTAKQLSKMEQMNFIMVLSNLFFIGV